MNNKRTWKIRREKLQQLITARTRVSRGGAMVRAQASHQCGPGLSPGVDAKCGLSLLLVLSLLQKVFSGYYGFPLSGTDNQERTGTFKRVLKNSQVPHGQINYSISTY